MAGKLCPCGSKLKYVSCCQSYHNGLPCPNTESLLRARFSAFVLSKKEFLIKTHHPTYITPTLISDLEDSSFEPFDLKISNINAGSAQDFKGSISYSFSYKQAHRTVSFSTTSLYSKLGEEWYYEKDL